MLSKLNSRLIVTVAGTLVLATTLAIWVFAPRLSAAAEDDGHAHEADAGHEHDHAADVPEAEADVNAHYDHEDVVLYQIEGVSEDAIDTATVERGRISATVLATGRILPDPDGQATVSPIVSGRVTRLCAGMGDAVDAGETLAIIESTDATQAYAALDDTQARLKYAEQELERTKRLAKAGAYTVKPVDEVRRERAEVAAELAQLVVEQEREREGANADVTVAEVALKRAVSARDFAEAELDRERALVKAGATHYPPLEAAQGDVAEARSDVATSQARLVGAEGELKRVEGLVGLGTAAQRELEAAQTAEAEAAASVERAKAQLQIAEQAVAREQSVFDQGIYADGEVEAAEMDLAKAEGDVDEHQATLDQAKSMARIAGSDSQQQALAETKRRLAALDSLLDREKLVAEQELMADRAIEAQKAEIARARVELQAARNAVRIYKARRGSSGTVTVPVVAPIGGVVQDRPAKLGDSVGPGSVLFTVLDHRKYWADIDIYERDLPNIRTGQPVRLYSSDVPDWEHLTHIDYIVPVLDEETRTACARVLVADASVMPGMFVNAEVSIGSGEEMLLVPIAAIADEATGNAVYIKWPNDEGWERHAVEVVARDSQTAAIVGPAAGAKVATKGLSLVQAAVRTQMAGGEGVATGHEGHNH